jgi:hypothetical protein
MSEDMMPKRWSVGNYDGYMVEWNGGDYVEAEDVEPLLAEITRLRARVEVLEKVREAAEGVAYGYDPDRDMGAIEASVRALIKTLEAKP